MAIFCTAHVLYGSSFTCGRLWSAGGSRWRAAGARSDRKGGYMSVSAQFGCETGAPGRLHHPRENSATKGGGGHGRGRVRGRSQEPNCARTSPNCRRTARDLLRFQLCDTSSVTRPTASTRSRSPHAPFSHLEWSKSRLMLAGHASSTRCRPAGGLPDHLPSHWKGPHARTHRTAPRGAPPKSRARTGAA